MLTVYGLKSCDTCRAALRWLEANGIPAELHDLRQDGVDVEMIARWSDSLGWEQLLNRRSLTWRRIPENDRDGLDRGRAIGLMAEYPTLIKRPLLERGSFVAVGFSPEDYEKVFAGSGAGDAD